MSSDFLLKIDGVTGESIDKDVKEAIEIDSSSWGVQHPGTFSDGTQGGASGQSHFSDITFSTRASKASPTLANFCAIGQHIKKVELHVRKATGKGGQKDYYIVKLEDCLISTYHSSVMSDASAIDSFSINYAKINFDFKPQKKEGDLDTAVNFDYDLRVRGK